MQGKRMSGRKRKDKGGNEGRKGGGNCFTQNSGRAAAELDLLNQWSLQLNARISTIELAEI